MANGIWRVVLFVLGVYMGVLITFMITNMEGPSMVLSVVAVTAIPLITITSVMSDHLEPVKVRGR